MSLHNYKKKMKFFEPFMLNMNDPRNFRVYHSIEMMNLERERHRMYYKGRIHPHSRFRVLWELFFSIFMIFNIIFCFIYISIYRYTKLRTEIELSLIFLSEMPVVIDIFLSFFTGYIKENKGEATMKFTKIFWHYLKFIFIIDVYGATWGSPIISFFHFNTKIFHNNISYVFWFLNRIIAVLCRGFKPWYYLRHNISAYYRLDPLVSNSIEFYLFVPIIILFFSTIILTGNYELIGGNYTIGYNLEDGLNNYLNIFLDIWSMTGTVIRSSKHPLLVIVKSISVLFTYFRFFIITTFLILIFVARRGSLESYNDVIDNLNEYFQRVNISLRLKIRIRKYYEETFQRKFYNEFELCNKLSSELREDIVSLKIEKLRNEIIVLKLIPLNELLMVCSYLESEVYFGNDVIAYSGTPSDRMYFVARGSVAIYNDYATEIYHTSNSMLFLTTNVQSNVIPVLLNYLVCETTVLYSISRNNYLSIINKCPVLKEVIDFFHSVIYEYGMIINEKSHERNLDQ